MTSESGFDGGQENSLPATPLASVMGRLRQFRDGFTSPRPSVTPPVTSPTTVSSFSETSARTSSNEPPPLNGDVGLRPTSQHEHRIVPRLVTSTLLDASSITQELDEFRLQQHATQMITQVLDESRDNEFERNRLIREDREARKVEQQQQVQLAQFAMFQRFPFHSSGNGTIDKRFQ